MGMLNKGVLVEHKPKERTIISFILGAFFGRYFLPWGERLVWLGITLLVWLHNK